MIPNIPTRRITLKDGKEYLFANEEILNSVFNSEGEYLSSHAEAFHKGIFWYLTDDQFKTFSDEQIRDDLIPKHYYA